MVMSNTKCGAALSMSSPATNDNHDPRFGSLYDEKLSCKGIAAILRKRIAAAVKSGALPKIKVSVRSDYNHITVRVTEAPFCVVNPARVVADIASPHVFSPLSRVSFVGEGVLGTIKAWTEAYNYDRSDIMTDYFDVNFYTTIDFAWELAKDHRERILASLAVAS
jgi:hypothetical protein